MGASFRSWRQQIKQHRVAIGVVAIVLIVVIVLIIIGYLFDWTGFNGYNKVTIAHTISGTNAGTVIRTEEYQPGKGLWDWLQLLIIPAVLAVAGYIINLTISRGEQEATKQRAQSEREAAEKRAETEYEIALDNQRETALKEYIDKMSELFLHEDLLCSDPKKEVREIARIQTLTVLNRLDGKRKGSVLQFLNDSNLVNKDNTMIDLEGANLSGANLCQAHLNGARLFHVDLSAADLSAAYLGLVPFGWEYDEPDDESEDDPDVLRLEASDLRYANLNGANLSAAYLAGADLRHAKLIGANLSAAYLFATKLSQADLTRANLSHADLGYADLSDANLTEADLTNTVLDINSDEYLSHEIGPDLKGATMPDGSKHP